MGKSPGLKLQAAIVQDNIPAQVAPGLFVGSMHAAFNMEALQERNITHIVNLAGTYATFPELFTYLSVRLRDKLDANLLSCVPFTMAFIDAAIQNDGAVLVHCAGGRSRSPAMAICYLMITKSLNFEQALVQVRNARPLVALNLGFEMQLKCLEQARGDVFQAQQLLLTTRLALFQKQHAYQQQQQQQKVQSMEQESTTSGATPAGSLPMPMTPEAKMALMDARREQELRREELLLLTGGVSGSSSSHGFKKSSSSSLHRQSSSSSSSENQEEKMICGRFPTGFYFSFPASAVATSSAASVAASSVSCPTSSTLSVALTDTCDAAKVMTLGDSNGSSPNPNIATRLGGATSSTFFIPALRCMGTLYGCRLCHEPLFCAGDVICAHADIGNKTKTAKTARPTTTTTTTLPSDNELALSVTGEPSSTGLSVIKKKPLLSKLRLRNTSQHAHMTSTSGLAKKGPGDLPIKSAISPNERISIKPRSLRRVFRKPSPLSVMEPSGGNGGDGTTPTTGGDPNHKSTVHRSNSERFWRSTLAIFKGTRRMAAYSHKEESISSPTPSHKDQQLRQPSPCIALDQLEEERDAKLMLSALLAMERHCSLMLNKDKMDELVDVDALKQVAQSDLSTLKKLVDKTCDQIYIDPPQWCLNDFLQHEKGALLCPNGTCNQVLGAWQWPSANCEDSSSNGTTIASDFHVHKTAITVLVSGLAKPSTPPAMASSSSSSSSATSVMAAKQFHDSSIVASQEVLCFGT